MSKLVVTFCETYLDHVSLSFTSCCKSPEKVDMSTAKLAMRFLHSKLILKAIIILVMSCGHIKKQICFI